MPAEKVEKVGPIPGFVEMRDVQRQLGCSRWTWSLLMKETGMQMYAHPGNRRIRLLREEDAKRLLSPQPVSPRAPRKDRVQIAA